jgi:hypothetical protein
MFFLYIRKQHVIEIINFKYIKVALTARVRDLFTCTSKVINSFIII